MSNTAYLLRAPAGVPGALSRPDQSTVEPVTITPYGTTGAPAAFGLAGQIDATTGQFRTVADPDTAEGLKIASLQAYWELAPMMVQFARQGVPAMSAGLTLSRALLANQGADGAFGFARGLRRPGRRARAKVDDLLAALSGGDELSTRRILGHGAKVDVDLGLLDQRLRGAHTSKILAAGHSITVSLTAGRSEPRGVLIFDFADDETFRAVRFFA
mgnify:CR=1 FL=1